MEFETVQIIFFVAFTFLVTEGLKALSGLFGVELHGYGAAIVAALVALSMGLFELVLVPLIPPESLPIVDSVAHLLLVVLSSFGVHKTSKRFVPQEVGIYLEQPAPVEDIDNPVG